MSPENLMKSSASAQAQQRQLQMATRGMTGGQRAAMEVAESARDTDDGGRSFAAEMFMGRADHSLIQPFPQQSSEDRIVGDELVHNVSVFLVEHLDPDEVDENRTIPKQVIQGLRDLGVFRMKVPTEYGGLGLSQVNYNRVIMAVASHCASTAVLISAHQSIGVPQPLKMFGTDAQKAKYLPRIANGALSAFALTESEAGSDPARMSTTATLTEDGKHYILNGVKQWTTNGPIADLLVVMATTAPKVYRGKERSQITAFIVEADWPGVEVIHRCDFMGLRAISNGVIRFDNVKVPVDNVLWGEGLGLKLALKTLNIGRLTLPAACTGLAKQCLLIARQWGNERVQWGRPIGKHEVGSQKIAYIACTTFTMEAITWLTSHWADQSRNIRIEAAMAKLFCSEASWRIIDQTMQFRAGRGYERALSLRARGETAYPVERMMRDARINTIIEGTSEIMRLFLAREALDPHLKRAMKLLDPDTAWPGKLRAAAGLAGFYSKWYFVQVWGQVWPRRYRSMGPLARHYRYMDRTSHRLARVLFQAMARHQQKLERRQLLLARLMDIGTELFAMAAACAYAQSLETEDDVGDDAVQLADLFCRQARQRIGRHFRAVRTDRATAGCALAEGVLDGQFRWLEKGVIPVGDGPA